jgi:hypothetical protein
VQDLRLETRNDSREIGGLQQAREQGVRLRHGTADDSGSVGEETVLKVQRV